MNNALIKAGGMIEAPPPRQPNYRNLIRLLILGIFIALLIYKLFTL